MPMDHQELSTLRRQLVKKVVCSLLFVLVITPGALAF